MQAYKAYYDGETFVPIGLGRLQKGAQAIVTVLDEPEPDREARLAAIDKFFAAIEASDEEMPEEFERVRFNRELDL